MLCLVSSLPLHAVTLYSPTLVFFFKDSDLEVWRWRGGSRRARKWGAAVAQGWPVMTPQAGLPAWRAAQRTKGCWIRSHVKRAKQGVGGGRRGGDMKQQQGGFMTGRRAAGGVGAA